jgi:hypothetical protein
MVYGPVRTPSTQQRPENFLDELSNSGPAIRLRNEGSPLTLSSGKPLFVDDTPPAASKVTESKVSPNSIIIGNYEGAGAIRIGNY